MSAVDAAAGGLPAGSPPDEPPARGDAPPQEAPEGERPERPAAGTAAPAEPPLRVEPAAQPAAEPESVRPPLTVPPGTPRSLAADAAGVASDAAAPAVGAALGALPPRAPAAAVPAGALPAVPKVPAVSADRGGAAPAAHDPSVPPPLSDEVEKQRALDVMKRRATGLLVAAAALFVVASVLERRYPWLGFVRAFAEAAMVGGLADWFAVTALFRRPLGLPIPHTAIVPTRKDRIGRSLGRFVQQNFLSRPVIGAKLAQARVGERAGRWLADPERARLVARQVATGLSGAAEVLRDDDVQGFVERTLVARARRVQVAPLLGRVLGLLTADGRHQELLDEALRLLARVVDQNEDAIRDRIAAEAPWWVPGAVEDKIHERVVAALERTLQQVSADPEHPLRLRFDEAVRAFAERLRTSPTTIARAEAIKEEVLTHPAVRDYAGSVWTDVKGALARYASHGDAPEALAAVERGLVSLGNALVADAELQAKVDAWVTEAVLYVVEQYRGEVSQLIETTVAAWDPDATSRRIEVQIGRDLQFIRINGTLVGGLVGLALYGIARLIH